MISILCRYGKTILLTAGFLLGAGGCSGADGDAKPTAKLVIN
jgi:hypothetical protein